MRRKLILGAASWFGLGYLPKMPGTWGTLGAIPLWWAMSGLDWPRFLIVTVSFITVAIWISNEAEKIYGKHDVQHIVIDEVAGLLVAGFLVPFAWPEVVTTFLLFRLFDMTKPGPIRWLDRHIGGGVGVVIDDVVAGVAACLVMHAGRWLVGGWL